MTYIKENNYINLINESKEDYKSLNNKFKNIKIELNRNNEYRRILKDILKIDKI